MFKKFLFAITLAVGLLYGTGGDFAWLKRTIKGAADGNASSMTGGINDNGGWGRS